MKRLFISLIICLISFTANVKTQSRTNTIISYQNDWVVSIAQTADGSKRIKVKYQIDMFNNICSMCGAYVWNGYNWETTFIGQDQYGYYVTYYDRYYL